MVGVSSAGPIGRSLRIPGSTPGSAAAAIPPVIMCPCSLSTPNLSHNPQDAVDQIQLGFRRLAVVSAVLRAPQVDKRCMAMERPKQICRSDPDVAQQGDGLDKLLILCGVFAPRVEVVFRWGL